MECPSTATSPLAHVSYEQRPRQRQWRWWPAKRRDLAPKFDQKSPVQWDVWGSMVDCTMKIWSRCWKRAGLTFQIKNWRKDRWWKQNTKTLLHVLLFIQTKKKHTNLASMASIKKHDFLSCRDIQILNTAQESASAAPYHDEAWFQPSALTGGWPKKRCLKRTYDLESKSLETHFGKKTSLFEQLWEKKWLKTYSLLE